MNAGIGAGRTVPEHREWANQLYASYTQGREARLMAAIVGEAGLAEEDRRALAFAERFEREFINQAARRSLARDHRHRAGGCWRACRATTCTGSSDATWAARQAAGGGRAS